MKNRYGIGLFVISFVTIYLLSYTAFGNEEKESEKVEVRESVSVNGQTLKEDCYFLYEVNGYVAVYRSDRKTLYEYTDILYSELPELLRQEIQNGKYIESTEELYGFLENYSS